jgi:hypothetical protein
MRGSGLRSRLFRAIGVVVLICVAFTIGVGLVLTHRAVKSATLKDLAHQADLINAFEGIKGANHLPDLPSSFLPRGNCRPPTGTSSHWASTSRARSTATTSRPGRSNPAQGR